MSPEEDYLMHHPYCEDCLDLGIRNECGVAVKHKSDPYLEPDSSPDNMVTLCHPCYLRRRGEGAPI